MAAHEVERAGAEDGSRGADRRAIVGFDPGQLPSMLRRGNSESGQILTHALHHFAGPEPVKK